MPRNRDSVVIEVDPGYFSGQRDAAEQDPDDAASVERDVREFGGTDVLLSPGLSIDKVGGMSMVNLDGSPIDLEEFDEMDEGEEESPPVDPSNHSANLAMVLQDSDRNKLVEIGQKVSEWFDADLKSRDPWKRILEAGLSLLGLTLPEGDAAPFEGASECTHPALMEACINFQSRTSKEMLPAKGPVKPSVEGNKLTDADILKAERVARYMNHRLTRVDQNYYPDTERAHFWIPFYGCSFDKIVHDGSIGLWTIKPLQPLSVVFSYDQSFNTSSRKTHYFELRGHEYKQFVRDGVYMDIPLTPAAISEVDSDLQEKIDEASGQTGDDLLSETEDDDKFTFLEMRVITSLGESIDDGAYLPYRITVEKDSQRVVAIYRHWEEDDPNRKMTADIVMKPFVPGLGSYPYGFPHLFAGIVAACTDGMNLIMDASAFASMQGGFKTKEGGALGGEHRLRPGRYDDVDSTAEELAKAFWSPEFREPSPALFNMWQTLVEHARRAMFNTDTTAGDGKNTGPVGTTIALIEQASTTPSAVHARIHHANAQSFALLYKRMSEEEVPADGYPYDEGSEDAIIYQSDFNASPNICPVSDPAIYSNTQRIAMAQAMIDRATVAPGLYRKIRVERAFLEAIRAPNPDQYLIDPEPKGRMDPVTENAMALMGQGLMAKHDEHHAAHYSTHMAELQMLAMTKSPFLEVAQPILLSHAAQHKAFELRNQVAQALGIPPAPMTFDAESGRWEVEEQKMPPEVEARVAMGMAQWSAQQLQQLQQMIAQQESQGNPEAAAQAQAQAAQAEQEMKLKEAAHELDMKLQQARAEAEERRKQAAWDAEQERKRQELIADQNREAVRVNTERRRAEQEAAAKAKRDEDAAEQKLRLNEQTARHKQAMDVANACKTDERDGEDRKKAAAESKAEEKKESKAMEQMLKLIADLSSRIDKLASAGAAAAKEPVTINTGPVTQVIGDEEGKVAPPKRVRFTKSADGSIEAEILGGEPKSSNGKKE